MFAKDYLASSCVNSCKLLLHDQTNFRLPILILALALLRVYFQP